MEKASRTKIYDFRPGSENTPPLTSSNSGLLPDKGEGEKVLREAPDTTSLETPEFEKKMDEGEWRIGLFADMMPQSIITRIVAFNLDEVRLMGHETDTLVRNLYSTIVPDIRKEISIILDKPQDKRVALLLSGGVDSSVALHVLCEQGIKPDCFYIKIGPEEAEEWDCTSEEDLEMATAVARRYGCKLEVVDCHKEYWDKVTSYTMDKVRAGFTPNPDVMCNRLIKFGAFHEKRGHEYDIIATGHYAQTEVDEQGRKWLCTSPDPVKDQTDFLAQLFPWQLQKAIFPIGHLLKEELRQIAQREHLINANRKDSQGICFLGKINYNDYIRRYLGENPGDVIELETGRCIGRHRGLWFHTIGQRKGLGFGGGPWFAVKKDMTHNILYVSNGYDPSTAYKDKFRIADFNFLTANPWEGVDEPVNVTFKVRHTPDCHKARLHRESDNCFTVESEDKIHGVAPGQFCVIYDEQHHRCFGSGEIVL